MRSSYLHPVSTPALMLMTIVAGLLFMLGAPKSLAQPPIPAKELMSKVVANEIEHPKSSRFCMWMDRVAKPKGSWTKQMIETPDGIVARLVAINDKPLTPEQRRAEESRLDGLLDPANMRKKTSQQRTDDQHSQRLIRALPTAFDYAYSGTETTPAGHQIVKLSFSPDPSFVPPDYETQIYLGMKGQVWIDTEAMRVARIDGTLFKDVTLGWGIIGRLNKGGRLLLEQADVGNGHWDTTRLELDFGGKILLVKHLQLQETATEWDFHPVPKMSVREAIETLRRSGDKLASTATAPRYTDPQ
jgi:hypothetical protein